MEKPSAYGQWTLGLLVFLTVGFIVNLYVIGSGVIKATVPDAAGPFIALTIALGFLSLSLLWWGNRYGNLVAIVVAIVALMNFIFASFDISSGNVPSAVLIAIIPGFIGALGLIYTASMAWKG